MYGFLNKTYCLLLKYSNVWITDNVVLGMLLLIVIATSDSKEFVCFSCLKQSYDIHGISTDNEIQNETTDS